MMPAALDSTDPVVSQAIEWMVLLRSGAVTARELSEFEGWRRADPRHEAACQRIERVLGGIAASPVDAVARKALLKPVTRRRVMGSLLGLAGVGLVAYWAEEEKLPEQWLADVKTGTGKRQSLALAGGGSLQLNARTSVNVDQGAGGASLDLIAGEVMLRDVPAVLVRAQQGQLVARGAAFAVRRSRQGLRVAVLQGEVLLRPRQGAHRALRAGELALMNERAVLPLAGRSANAETAWVDGLLQVSDQPLGDVVAALRDYRSGVIRIDDAAAALRVSGVFSLDDTDRSLRAIAQTLAVRIRMTTPYWVAIETA
jgi:transmembrane sensor